RCFIASLLCVTSRARGEAGLTLRAAGACRKLPVSLTTRAGAVDNPDVPEGPLMSNHDVRLPDSRPGCLAGFPPLLMLLLAFAAGGCLDRRGWIPGRADRQPPGLRKTFAPFWEAWDKVQEHYVDRSKVDPQRLTEGAIAGLIASLGDVGHSAYLSKQAREG